jgi:hypothetical protein
VELPPVAGLPRAARASRVQAQEPWPAGPRLAG